MTNEFTTFLLWLADEFTSEPKFARVDGAEEKEKDSRDGNDWVRHDFGFLDGQLHFNIRILLFEGEICGLSIDIELLDVDVEIEVEIKVKVEVELQVDGALIFLHFVFVCIVIVVLITTWDIFIFLALYTVLRRYLIKSSFFFYVEIDRFLHHIEFIFNC